MFNKKDLRNLESIIMLYAIKECRGKRRAAKNLCMSIDTLNRYLQNLEQELGIRLLLTSSHRCVFTKEGEKILAEATQIETCLQKIYEVKDFLHQKNEMKIVCERGFFLPKMRLICKHYPKILFCFDSAEGVPDMDLCAYDVCFGEGVPKGKDVRVICKKSFSYGFFASPDYLRQNKKPENLCDLLENYPLILKQNLLAEFDEKTALQENCLKSVSNSSFIIKEMIEVNGGVGVLPLFYKEYSNLILLDHISCPFCGYVYLAARKDVEKTPYKKQVLNFYKNLLKNADF